MKLPLHLITFIFALLFSTAAFAQTTDYTLQYHNCGPYNGAQPYCLGEPYTGSDGSSGTVWIDFRWVPYAPMNYGFLKFSDPSLGTATIINIEADGTLQFQGTTSTKVNYYGVMKYYFKTYRSALNGRTYWIINWGNFQINKTQY